MATMTTTDDNPPAKKTASKPLTPSAAAARKRPPADRKPKQSTHTPPNPPQTASGQSRKPRETVDVSVDREAVDIGFDFRPIPVRLGAGEEHRWLFNPDPSVEQWAAIQAAVADYAENAKDTNSPLTFEEAADMVARIRAAIADLLAYEDDKPRFLAETRYGPMALLRLSRSLMEEVTGFPTTPSP